MTPEPRRRGRPKGHVLSEETKRRIGRGVREARRAGSPIPPGEGIALDVRRAVFDRDHGRCRGCDEPYVRQQNAPQPKRRKGWARTELDMVIHRFAAAGAEAGLEAYATLCGECRRGITRGTSTVDEYLSV